MNASKANSSWRVVAFFPVPCYSMHPYNLVEKSRPSFLFLENLYLTKRASSVTTASSEQVGLDSICRNFITSDGWKEHSLTLSGPATCTELTNKSKFAPCFYNTHICYRNHSSKKHKCIPKSMLQLHNTKGSNWINTLLVHSITTWNHILQTSHKTNDLPEDKTMLE